MMEQKEHSTAIQDGGNGDKSEKPHSEKWKQQECSTWEPRLTLVTVLITYVVVGVILLIVGPILYQGSNNIAYQTMRYDDQAGCTLNSTCTVTMVLDEDFDAPVYFYYGLTNFYQNHRSYVKSVDFKQIRGLSSSLLDCSPLQSYGDYTAQPIPSLSSKDLYPCGLVANTFFTDTFSATLNGAPLTGRNWQKKGIAWSTDLDHRYKVNTEWLQSSRFTTTSPYGGGFNMPNVTDEDLVVWMRTATQPTFSKLHRQILDRSLKKGDVLSLTIANNYDTAQYEGTKFVTLSTANDMGGRNSFIGIAFIVVGCLCLVAAAGFALRFGEGS